jgi:hypothetical protein
VNRPRDFRDHDHDHDFHDTRCLDELACIDHLQHLHELEHIDEPCGNYIDDFDRNRFTTETLELSNRHPQLLVSFLLAARAPA